MSTAHATAGLDRAALRDVWPIVLSVIPFGMLIGVTFGRTGVGTVLGLGSAALFFAGSAHLAALTLLATGAGPALVVGCVVVVNPRLALYGAALQPRFRDQPTWFRWLAPHLLIDQTYAIASARPELAEPARFRRYRLTAGATIRVGWLASHVAGALLGPALPPDSPLEITAPAVFVGLLAPSLRSRPAVLAATAAGVVAAAASVLPQGLGRSSVPSSASAPQRSPTARLPTPRNEITMSALVALSLGALATWVLRVTFITLLPADRLPARLRRTLPHVGPAVLAALVVTSLVGHGGLAALVVPSPQLVALLVAGLVAWRVRNLVAPIAAALP